MIKLTGNGDNIQQNKEKMIEKIQNGKAYNKFLEMVKNQNGDITYLQNIEKFEKAKYIVPICSEKEGYIHEINAEEVGKLACSIGAGRVKKEDEIDKAVGIELVKKVASYVKQGEILAYIHLNKEEIITGQVMISPVTPFLFKIVNFPLSFTDQFVSLPP